MKMTRSTSDHSTVDAGFESSDAATQEVNCSMEEAVGYAVLPCEHELPVADALALKQDRVFLLVDRSGNIAPAGRCSLGLFEDDTRILSYYELTGAGTPPVRLSAQVVQPFTAQIDLSVNDHAFGGDSWDPKHAIHLQRDLVVDEALIERLTLTNFLMRPIDYWIELAVGCDFADIFELRGWKRDARGQFFQPTFDDRSIHFAYRGRDGATIRSAICFREPPRSIGPQGARWSFQLMPGVPVQLEWEVRCERRRSTAVAGANLEHRRKRLSGVYDNWCAECSRWTSDVEVFDDALSRATVDLRSLYITAGGDRAISAGIPWYSTVFGRDSIITSIETLPLNPTIAVDTLRYLARRQGVRENSYTEEQPGRIMHELRRGELARSGEIPHVPYYGTIDATPLWLVLLHETWRWTGDFGLVQELLSNARRALEWIDRYGDLDGDGLVEYASTSARGLVNQGWKDSGDGIPFPDGRLPDPPIALIEVQGYVFDAKTRAAELFERAGDAATAIRLRIEAERMRAQVIDRFWLDDLGTFALALDGHKQPLPTVTSNAGHLLWSRLPDPQHASRVAHALLGPDMSCGWGIRTLSARHPVFNPMSYHNGSVWPHDNALIVMGLSQYGLAADALPIVGATQDAAAAADLNRLPELYCGISRDGAAAPVSYPVSCSPQAWASGALFLMLQGVLGIFPDAPHHLLHIRNPVLPSHLQELTITNLAVGRARVSLHFARHTTRTLVNVLAIESDDEPIQVRIELG
jgi:glycogen debranching enzyme